MRNLMSNPLVQLLSFVLLIVGAFTLLSKSSVGRVILLLIVVVAVFCVLLSLLVKYQPELAAKVYHSHKAVQAAMDPLYHVLALQPPAAVGRASNAGGGGSPPAEAPPPPLRFDDPDFDFDAEADELKEMVCGQDAVIDSVMASLDRVYMIKSGKETEARTPPPHGIFLFIGPEGVGKIHLAKLLSRTVFNSGSLFRRDMADFTGASAAGEVLFGGQNGAASMLAAVLKQPYHAVLLENIEQVAPEVLMRLHKALAAGAVIEPNSKSKVSFENCLFIFTTAACAKPLLELRAKFDRPAPWLNAARKELVQQSTIPAPLLTLLNDVCALTPPDGMTKAQVLVLLMERECQSQGLELDYVDPDFLAEQVKDMDDAHGFALLTPNRVREMMGDAMLEARRKKTTVQVGGVRPKPARTAASNAARRKETIRP